MKKIMRFVTVLGAASFILGFIISIFEKRKEKVGRKKEERHHFYGPYERSEEHTSELQSHAY